MNPYEYYEFYAATEALSRQEQREVRALCPAARVTPRRVVSEQGLPVDPESFFRSRFDAMIHVAHWGTHRALMRLSPGTIRPATLRRYCAGESARVLMQGREPILDFTSEVDAPEEGEDGEGWMSALLRVRADLLDGDLRPLYLGWLVCAQCGEVGPDAREPPLPEDLLHLSRAQERFATFLRVDDDMLWVAAESSRSRRTASELLRMALLLQQHCQQEANLRGARAQARRELSGFGDGSAKVPK